LCPVMQQGSKSRTWRRFRRVWKSRLPCCAMHARGREKGLGGRATTIFYSLKMNQIEFLTH
jgi:hypothetical protein